ncbi:MAG: glycosyltransferase [Kiritimatiellia bacterium]
MTLRTAPIALFVFRRPRHTRRTLEALARNKMADTSRLIVFCDGPRSEKDESNVREVRQMVRTVSGFAGVEVVERSRNFGLARSIREGVDAVLSRWDRVIVLEDDLLVHPAFLTYMNGALNAYAEDARILSVSAYMPPRWRVRRPPDLREDVWLSVRNLSFGWGTWRNKWQSVDWEQARKDDFTKRPDLQQGFAQGGGDLPGMLRDQLNGKLDSWAVPFSYAHYRSGRGSVLPVDSYVKPIGFDGSGVHCGPNPLRWFETTRRAGLHPEFPPDLRVHAIMQWNFRRFFGR